MRFGTTGLRLPTKLLGITLLFVMLAEVLVFVPSLLGVGDDLVNRRRRRLSQPPVSQSPA